MQYFFSQVTSFLQIPKLSFLDWPRALPEEENNHKKCGFGLINSLFCFLPLSCFLSFYNVFDVLEYILLECILFLLPKLSDA